MTFLVNHSGTVYQKDLGDYTRSLVGAHDVVRSRPDLEKGRCIPSLTHCGSAAAVSRYSAGLATLLLVLAAGLPTPSHAQAPGYVSVVFAKAGLIVGAGGGRGVLTYRGRDYPFRVSGLSLGFTVGASAMRLSGRVSNLRELKDFSGTYDAVGAGGALGRRLWRGPTDQQERRDHRASGRRGRAGICGQPERDQDLAAVGLDALAACL